MNGRPTDSLRSAGSRLAGTLIVGVTLLLGWWIWRQGAYFDAAFYPGALALVLLVGLLVLLAPFPGLAKGPAFIALAALAALAVWTAASGLWSDVPSAASAYSSRVFAYAAAFLLGIWLVLLLRERMTDALIPLAVAGGLIGIATTVVLATGDDSAWYLHDDATLRFPIGYRNANAALLMTCMWPMLAFASDNARHWAGRALATAGATVMIELAILSQSRGSLPATIVALVVFIAAMPHRLRAASVAGLAALPALPALPTLLDVYRHGTDEATVLVYLQDAARMIGLTGLLSVALAAFALVVVYPRLNLGADRVRLVSRLLAVTAVIVAVAGAGAFVARHGGPVEFADQRVEEFTSIGYPDLSEQGVRYGANVGSNRGDFWRVSLDIWRQSPLAGAGAGSFEPRYLRQRRSLESPQDPHSVEMLMLSEQGLVGLALLLTFVVAAGLAVLRSRRLGTRAAILCAAALAAGVQWLMPASYDWFWQYAGVTTPAIFLLGAAAAPALIDPGGGIGRPLRLLGAALCLAVAVAIVPLYLADRYSSRALATDTPAEAIADYRRAADLSPWSAKPLVEAARLELAAGEPGRAAATARRAIEREPTDYAANLVLAQALIAGRRSGARAQLARLRALSPLAAEIEILERRLGRAARPPD